MKRLKLTLGILAVLATLAGPASAAPINVALGATVTSTGTIGVITCCFDDASVWPPAPLSNIVDGVYLPSGTYWQDGTVWWDDRNPGSTNNWIQIELNGRFLIDYVSIQADNNDNYSIYSRDQYGNWFGIGTAVACCSAGMWERAGAFVPPFESTAFILYANGGDGFYSISEFQAIGTAVPEPASLLLLGSGLTLVARRVRRQK